LLIGGRFNSHALPLYSVLISPAYFFTDMGDTFTVIKLINSLVMSSAIFPVFLLARRFMLFGRAFTVALLSVMIGPMFYTFIIMAESLHYPLSMWLIYLIYISFVKENRRINLTLGLVFGLAVLNKMSSLAVFVCYNILLGISFNESNVFRSLKRFPVNYLRAVLKYKYVFIALTITVLPYLVYRAIAAENSHTVPYTVEWLRFVSNIADFDVLKYFKWCLIYVGQLNLSTGLFLLPLSTFVIISLCRSDERHERIFGVSSVILMVGVLALAVLQSGYNFERLTERHFFVLSPLVFILSFMWLQSETKILSKLVMVPIGVGFVIATCVALFAHSMTAWPAVDSAFIDFLLIAIRQGANELILKLVVLILSILLMIVGCFMNSKKGYVGGAAVAFVVMVTITIPCYSDAIRHSKMLKKSRMPLINLINESVSYPANLIFLFLPRFVAIDHIIWNKDRDNKIYWQARLHLQNPSSFRFKDYSRVKRELGVANPTYFISPFFTYCGAKVIKSSYGIDIYETTDPQDVKICGFYIDFGASYTRQVLKKGWSGDEGPYPNSNLPTFVWATGRRADIDVYVEMLTTNKTLAFRAMPYPSGQSVSVMMNGKNVGNVKAKQGWQEYRLLIDSELLKPGKNSITFKFKHAKSPAESGGRDSRKLAMAFDWLRLEDATGAEP